MKLTKFVIPMMMTALLLGQNLKAAEEITLPVITKPAILDEGTQRVLSPDQIAELLPWAKDSKLFLTDALNDLDSIPMSLKVERLLQSIKQVVQDSGSKNSELFMRYILNRGLAVNDILSKEVDMDAIGSIDAQFRILRQTVEMAIKYYDIDMTIINKKGTAPFKDFGVEYFNFLTSLNNSIFDASAQYNIQRTALEFLQWDLYRDLNNKSFAPQIVKINNNLKFFPVRKMRDAESIALIRQMKKVTVGMELGIRKEERSNEDTYKRPEGSTSTETRIDDNLKIGDSVLVSGYPGSIVAVRADGSIMVRKTSGEVVTTTTSAIGYVKGCVDGFCVGERVLEGGYDAVITGVKKNKEILIYRSGWSYSESRTSANLGKKDGCNNEKFCVGQSVIDNTGYPVTITGIRKDNKLFVFQKGWSYSEIRDSSSLARTSGCAGRNVCVKDAVYLSNGQLATVTGIVNATTVRVIVSGWSYSELRTVESLGLTK
nr:hypothetical protein BHI3_07340 [Bacteriovorax sp. HI3]